MIGRSGNARAWRFYLQHEKPLQVLAAVFLAGATLGNLYVTRDSAERTTAALSEQIGGLAQQMQQHGERQAVTDFRLAEHQQKIEAVEVDVVTLQARVR